LPLLKTTGNDSQEYGQPDLLGVLQQIGAFPSN